MKPSVPYLLPEAREKVLDLVGQGRLIPAIKLVRQVTGAGLKEAKEYVDALKGEAFARTVPPEVRERARALIVEGRWKEATKLVRAETDLGLRGAKDYIDAVREGRVREIPAPGGVRALLSDRVRAFKDAGDDESALALVCAETGMSRDEARRFVDALH